LNFGSEQRCVFKGSKGMRFKKTQTLNDKEDRKFGGGGGVRKTQISDEYSFWFGGVQLWGGETLNDKCASCIVVEKRKKRAR